MWLTTVSRSFWSVVLNPGNQFPVNLSEHLLEQQIPSDLKARNASKTVARQVASSGWQGHGYSLFFGRKSGADSSASHYLHKFASRQKI
jgi:hypothetical protein